MSEKILTISVAAYNVSDYIRQCLDSLVGVEGIEVLVIDDGSADDTLNIANEYQNRYPDIFNVIHKVNGGYGSTVNYSIEHATCKYFRLLDGDDWYNKEGLKKIVEYLKNTDVDCVFTKFKKHFYDKTVEKKIVDGITFKNIDKIININDLDFNEGIPMHCITYKTELLAGLKLKEHMLYTDNYYATLPFKKINNVIFKDINVYNYRLGTKNQSVSKDKLIKNANDLKIISLDLAKEYKGENEYLLNRIAATCVDYFVILTKMKNSKNEMISYDKKIKSISEDVYKKMVSLNRKASKILKINRLFDYMLFK